MLIRQANIQDCNEICALLCENYLKETIFTHMTYDHAQTLKKVYEWVDAECCFVLVVGKRIAGMSVIEFGRTFYAEKEADVAMFYILPEFRATGASRALRDKVYQFAKENGAMLIYSLSGSGMSDKNDNLYCNLWRKIGLRKLGTCMIGEINNG